MIFRFVAGAFLLGSALLLAGCQGLVKGVSQLTVNVSGPGAGTVTSTPAGSVARAHALQRSPVLRKSL